MVGARDLDGQSLRTALRDFLDKASAAGPDMQAFVYLAGRGLQYNGDNYFVPVDAQINRDADVSIDALRISDFAHALAQMPGKARIIVLDAARANPYASQGAPLAPGLALVDPEPGELIAFNAAPGTLAGDEQGPYGVYGKTLAGAMRQGGVGVEEVFDQTRVTVNQLTQGALLPWSASKLTEPYYIFERAADAPPPAAAAAVANQPIGGLPADAAYAAALQRDDIQGYEDYLAAFPHSAQARRVRAILAALREASFWRHSVDANTAHAYWTYLRRYPKGPHVADARRRLAMISAAYEPPPDFQPMVYQDLPPPPPDEDFYEAQPYYAFDEFGPPPPPPPPEYYQEYYYVEDDDWRDLPPPPPPPGIGFLPVLPIGIPLVVGAVAYQHYNAYNRNGIAPAGLPRVPAAAARAAASATQHYPGPAAPSDPGPCSRNRHRSRQTASADWRSRGAGREAAGGSARGPPSGRQTADRRAYCACLGREGADWCASCALAGRETADSYSWRSDSAARSAGDDSGREAAGRCDVAVRGKAADGRACRARRRGSADGSSRNAAGRKVARCCDIASRGKPPAGTLIAPAPGKALPVPPPPTRARPDDAKYEPETVTQSAGTGANASASQIQPLAPKPNVNPPLAAPTAPVKTAARSSRPCATAASSGRPHAAAAGSGRPCAAAAAPVVHAPPPPARSFACRRRQLRSYTCRRRRLRSYMRRRLRLRSYTRRRRLRSFTCRRRQRPRTRPNVESRVRRPARNS